MTCGPCGIGDAPLVRLYWVAGGGVTSPAGQKTQTRMSTTRTAATPYQMRLSWKFMDALSRKLRELHVSHGYGPRCRSNWNMKKTGQSPTSRFALQGHQMRGTPRKSGRSERSPLPKRRYGGCGNRSKLDDDG